MTDASLPPEFSVYQAAIDRLDVHNRDIRTTATRLGELIIELGQAHASGDPAAVADVQRAADAAFMASDRLTAEIPALHGELAAAREALDRVLDRRQREGLQAARAVLHINDN